MSRKVRVAIIFGGKSAEHEISLISAMNIIAAINREIYEPVLIGVDKTGKWFLQDEEQFMSNTPEPHLVKLATSSDQLSVIPGDLGPELYNLGSRETVPDLDAVFPIIHGPLGEDGSLQGLLRLINLPYVGPDVVGSAVAMDKDIAKRLLTEAGIPNSKFHTYRHDQLNDIDAGKVIADLGLPLFIKPANMGSSVGISKVEAENELLPAVEKAFQFDTKILIEEFIKGREIECAVLGNEELRASIPGEIIPKNDFYSYEAKYVDESGAGLEAPAKNISDEKMKEIQELAIKTFQVLACEGLSRVDFFMTEAGKLYINEVNTLPGFTKISMYPKLWSLSGIEYSDLIDQLIKLAIERHERESELQSSVF